MKKSALLLICCLPLLGTSCPTKPSSIGPACGAPNLDGSAFGFTLAVPATYKCTTVEANPDLIVFVRYTKGSTTSQILSVTVSKPDQQSSTDNPAGSTVTDLGSTTNANNVTFARSKVSLPLGGLTFYSYVATATLKNANILGVTFVSTTDDAAIQTDFDATLATVAFP